MKGFILLIVLTFCDKALCLCADRTSIYSQHGSSNADNFYYVPSTYLGTAENIVSTTYLERLRQQGITCVGVWCPPGGSWCAGSQCYQVEHMIPRKNTISGLEGCCGTATKNHCDNTANFIMAYGTWNNQLSNSYIGEKVEIYGREKMMHAYVEIYKSCHGENPKTIPGDLCSGTETNMLLITSIICISIVVLVVFSVLGWHYFNRALNDDGDNNLLELD